MLKNNHHRPLKVNANANEKEVGDDEGEDRDRADHVAKESPRVPM